MTTTVATRSFTACLVGAIISATAALAQGGSQAPLFSIDFSDYQPGSGSIREWLVAKGFESEHNIRDPDAIVASFKDGSLQIKTEAPAFRLIYLRRDVPDVARIRITWGVTRFPANASYEHKINNEALMVYVSFGHDKLPSGSWFVPDSPYFIGMSLCDQDPIERPFIGQYYEKGGRFVCLGHPEPGARVTTEFDLASAFKSYFGTARVPAVSGISLEVDTTQSGDRGRAAAFINRIDLLK
jgi:hypothetical protein